jgi:glycosyltransferase involved in cell wall biosynthesis
MPRTRICIVSSSCLSSGPRVEKEADALAAAGHEVQVLVYHGLPWMQAWDAALAGGKAWSYTAFARHGDATSRALQFTGRAVKELSHFGVRAAGTRAPLAEFALSDTAIPLWSKGRAMRADLFIAHNLAALPVAAEFARRNRVPLAFDAEDDHFGELADHAQTGIAGTITDAILARYLPRCELVTAASDGIATNLADRYGIRRPTVVHNVFPLSLRDGIDGRRIDRRGAPVSLYWYSQTLGLDRGIQDVIRAAGLLRGDFEIHLRGHAPHDVRSELLRVAASDQVRQRIVFHPQVHPSELLSRSAEHDIGLALEQPISSNRLQTATNKLFFYMIAGLALAATDTPGQRQVLTGSPDAGFMYAPGDTVALARGVQCWLDDHGALARARVASLAAAQTWCWERERENLVAAYAALFARTQRLS